MNRSSFRFYPITRNGKEEIISLLNLVVFPSRIYILHSHSSFSHQPSHLSSWQYHHRFVKHFYLYIFFSPLRIAHYITCLHSNHKCILFFLHSPFCIFYRYTTFIVLYVSFHFTPLEDKYDMGVCKIHINYTVTKHNRGIPNLLLYTPRYADEKLALLPLHDVEL